MRDWLSRFRGNIGVGVNIIGLVVALILGLAQCPQYWYIPLICVGSFAILVFAYPRPSNIRRPVADQHVPDVTSQALLAAAVRPSLYPLCVNLATSRAAGTAVAALAALEVATGARHLWDKLQVLAGEMSEERVFTPDKLEEHLAEARRLRGILSGVTYNLSTECLRLFPEGEIIYRDLSVFDYYLDQKVIKPMEDLLRRLPQVSDPTPDIAEMLKNTCPEAIYRLLSPANLSSVENRARQVHSGAQIDWLNDLLGLWQVDSCHPNALTPPTPPKELVNFIGRPY